MISFTEADNFSLICTKNATSIIEIDDDEDIITNLLKKGGKYTIIDTKIVAEIMWYMVKQENGEFGWFEQDKYFQFVA